MISCSNCDISFGDSFSLKAVDWHVADGEAWVIAGPNGSGKSALVAALAGEGEVRAGTRSIDAARVAVVSLEEQARLIAREKERDDSDLTDVVAAGTPVAEMIDEVCRDESLKSVLVEHLGLASLMERGFRKLSTGETRKLLLIRALISRPDLLILDEPFEGLDVGTAPAIRDLLASLAGQVTMVMALNRLDEMPSFTTHVLRLEDGRVAQQMSVNDVGEMREILSQINQIRSMDLSLPEPEVRFDVPLNEDGTLVAIRGGRVAYTDNVVFEGLNWQILPGEHWQVRGPNGSGKTCLLNLITGDHPQCYVNDIRLFGYQRGQGESIWQIKQYLGFVSTGLHWDYRLSVSVRNVIISGFYDSIGLYQRATEKETEIAEAWLRLLGMAAKGGTSFAALSYGEQRVLLIARAMVKHPPLLLLDEPCLGLDDVNRQLVLSLIERIGDEGMTTLVYVTHHDEDHISHISNQLELG